MTIKMNGTLNTTLYVIGKNQYDFKSMDTDFFSGIYQCPLMKFLMIFSYIVGFFGFFGLLIVVWFERTGQAGQFRTLLNQLNSLAIDQVLEQRQYKNNSMEFRCMLILNLPPCFPHRIAE